MNKLQYYLARFIVPVFLLQALNPEAQVTQPPLPTDWCDSLSKQPTGVRQRLDQYSELVRGRKCVVLSSDPRMDSAQLINRIPENTVILLSSHTTIRPIIHPTGDTPIDYFINSEIVLKDGQDIIGAADDGFQIVIKLKPSYKEKFMIRVGTRDNFQFEKTKSSHIRHVTFVPKGPRYRSPVNAIVLAECYNRKLIMENNEFLLPYWTAINLDCKKPLDASANVNQPGPGLLFANNLILGAGIRTLFGLFFAEEGIHINLPAIQNQSQRLAVIGNRFLGRMAEAGEFILGPGARLDVFRNRVAISNIGITLRSARGQQQSLQGGFALIGHKDSDSEPPVYNLAGNQIRATAAAITVSGPLKLALACNHLQAVSPWLQLQPTISLKSANPLPLGNECGRVMSSSIVIPTPDSTIDMPTLYSTVDIPTLNSTVSTQAPKSTAGLSTTDSTSVMPGLESTTGLSTPDSTSVMPGLESTAGLSTPNSTSVMPGLESTVGMPTPNSTFDRPTPYSTLVMPTPNSYTINQIRNTWTAINGSTANACSGLLNFEGQFFFDKEVCQTVNMMTHAFFITDTTAINSRTHDTVKTFITPVIPTSSAVTNLVTTSALGVIVTLAILLSL